MIRKASGFMRASLALTALVGGALLIGGCGDSASTDASMTPPVAAPTAPPVATPTAPVKLKFDQLTLDSKPARKTDSNGLVFYTFSYSDRDGKVYKCNLPEAMAQGEFSTDGWIRTFNLYREPEVIRQKAIKNDANKDGLNDFPFIAPRPSAPAAGQSAPAQASPAAPPMPTYPSAPAAPANQAPVYTPMPR